MVDLSISDGNLLLNVRGADKLWAFRVHSKFIFVQIKSAVLSACGKKKAESL